MTINNVKKKKIIKNYLDELLPNVISNIITEYSDNLIGNCDLSLQKKI